MHYKKTIVVTLLLGGLLSTLVGCNTSSNIGGDVVYPDYPLTPGDKDSWEYLKDENGNVEPWEFEWYVNDSTFSWNSYGSDRVSQIIKEKTGVTIKFTAPVTDDGQKLSTLISGNKLPDVISVQCWYNQCHQLADQGYLYPLDGLIERWAPSFVEKEQKDIWRYFSEKDGLTYGVPNFAYSTQYVNDTDKMEPNGCLLVRKDWYQEASNAGYDMTSPSSFIVGCEYIKAQHSDAIPFQLAPFTSEGNASLDWLSQYFCSAYEDSTGNYQDTRLTARYQEMMEFLNTCTKKGLILSANFSDKAEQIKTKIARGNVFVSAVTPQDYQMAFINCYSNKHIEYVPLVLKNKDGQAPILQDISGNGYLLTMVTRNCKRPDKVIKVLEYLYSEEGQRLVAFGIEGESYNWNADHTAVEWTDRYVAGINGDAAAQAWINELGLYQMTLLMNLAYINKIKPLNGRRDTDIYIDNLKRPMTPYSYNFKPTFLKHDTSKENYFNIATKYDKIKTKWAEYTVNVLRGNNWKTEYDNAIKYLKRIGLDEVNEFYATSYQETKQLLGVEWGYPMNKPGYTEPVTGPNGDPSYYR